jgi:putative nucleotidyltransferase with HDIG domain
MRTRALATPLSVLLLATSAATLTTLVARVELFAEPLSLATAIDNGAPAPVTLRIPSTHARLPMEGELRIAHPRIARGAPIPEEAEEIVRSYELQRRPLRLDELVGTFFACLLVYLLLGTWLRTLSPSRGTLVRTQLGLFGAMLGFLVLGKGMLLLTDVGTSLAPLAVLTLWTRVYLDRRTAFLVAIAGAALIGALVDFDPIAMTTLAAQGMTPVLFARDRRRPVMFVLGGALGGLAAAGTFAASRVLFVGYFDLFEELADPLRSELCAAAAGGLLAGVVSYSLLSVALAMLGAVSRHRLLELTDLDHPLLRRMAKDAPGSWEHARAMANLAEAATSAIGGDALLVRVGAYYHDLGKTIQPKYYVENLVRGEKSPHLGLPPDLSADAIRAHVLEGVHILRDGGIPEPVVEFAYTHHGTSVIEYFWHQNLKNGNPKNLDDAFFRYPGMRPRTKETGILMLVDAVEAASRTIDPPERGKFEEMVQRIVFNKLRQGQLDESGLTMTDMRVVTAQLVETLCNIHHSRIRYPWQDKKGTESDLPAPGAATEADMEKEVAREVADTTSAELPATELEAP